MSKIALSSNTSGTGVFTIASLGTNTNRTLTLPDATTTLVGTDNTQLLTNKFFITNTSVLAATPTGAASIEIGATRSGDGNSYIDLIGDATYTDYGTRLIRNAGSTGSTILAHRGTGDLIVTAQDAGAIVLQTQGIERMRIDTNGAVTKPYQPAFIAKGLAAQTTYTATQVIIFNTAAYNVGSGYNTSNGRFTATVAGLYSFSYQIFLNPGNANTPVGFYKNGTLEIFYNPQTTMYGMGLTALISLAAGDYVDVRVRSGGGNVVVFNGGDHTQFRGYLVG